MSCWGDRPVSFSMSFSYESFTEIAEIAHRVSQVADALSKLVKMIAEVTIIVEKREPIIKLIAEVEEAFKEIKWHYQHQQQGVYNNRVSTSPPFLAEMSRFRSPRKLLFFVIYIRVVRRCEHNDVALLNDCRASEGSRARIACGGSLN